MPKSFIVLAAAAAFSSSALAFQPPCRLDVPTKLGVLPPSPKRVDTHAGYHVGDSEEEIMLRTPSLRVESLMELKVRLGELLNECDEIGEMDMEKNKTYKPKPGSLVYTT